MTERDPSATSVQGARPAAITFWYKNYRGEAGYRCATPISIRYGTSEWHKEPQWLLLAFDEEKKAEREFALSDVKDVIGRRTPLSFMPPAQTEGSR